MEPESLPESGDTPGAGEQLSRSEAVELVVQITGLTAAGFPLETGLRALAREVPSRRLGRRLDAVAGRVEAGVALPDALLDDSIGLPAHLRGLVLAGIKTGRLGEILQDYVRQEQVAAGLRRRLWLSLAYPLMLLMTMTILYIFISVVVIVDMASIYKDFGIALPMLTQQVLALSTAIVEQGLPLLVGTTLILVVCWLLARLFIGEGWYRWLVGRIPVVGLVGWWGSLAEFCHLFALLLESGLPLGESLRLVGEGVSDPDIAHVSRRLEHQVREGVALEKAIESEGWFPVAMRSMLAWAQTHQSLPEGLHMVGDMFEARAHAQASFVGTFLGTSTVILVLLAIGLTVAALFIPLIQLISRLSG